MLFDSIPIAMVPKRPNDHARLEVNAIVSPVLYNGYKLKQSPTVAVADFRG